MNQALFRAIHRHQAKHLARQNRQCAFCSRNIALARATLRRRDNQFARSRDNAMCLCLPCSVRAGNPHYKRKMVVKRQLAITEPQP